ncbi:MAG: hypothetical protein B6I36_10210 [Desulfobacteraceae bacterium 4572_35.1]|nr:MAG: hypothetical protein B6I36_10210 [Desulfobacteraceae bacterium 4572_35.1]
MANFIPITKKEFANKCWQRISSYSFTANDTICPLVMQELPKAQLSLPIAIAYINKQPVPVALQGIKPNSNLLVDKNGKWIGKYIPAAYRGYPFLLANTEVGKHVLCFDQESDLLTDAGQEVFFDDSGEPSAAVQGILNFLTQIHNDRQRTQSICTLLHEKNLIQPWAIKLKNEQGEVPVEGLFRIDEQALNALDKDDFEEIRQTGALPLIYCQLLSMQHLQALAQLANHIEKQKTPEMPDIEKIFGEGSGDQLFKF